MSDILNIGHQSTDPPQPSSTTQGKRRSRWHDDDTPSATINPPKPPTDNFNTEILQNNPTEIRTRGRSRFSIIDQDKEVSTPDFSETLALLTRSSSSSTDLLVPIHLDLSPEQLCEAGILHMYIQELTTRINSPEYYLQFIPQRDRSPSPAPVFDAQGNRTNRRQDRLKMKMQSYRSTLISSLIALIPTYTVSGYVKERLHKRVPIPVEDHPNFNFSGIIIGPRGSTHRQLEKSTGCKISVRGNLPNETKKMNEFSHEPPHVYIEGDRWEQVESAAEQIRQLLIVVDDSQNAHKTRQLQELAILNGLVQESNNINNKLQKQKDITKYQGQLVTCNHCGSNSHVTSDCPYTDIDFASDMAQVERDLRTETAIDSINNSNSSSSIHPSRRSMVQGASSTSLFGQDNNTAFNISSKPGLGSRPYHHNNNEYVEPLPDHSEVDYTNIGLDDSNVVDMTNIGNNTITHNNNTYRKHNNHYNTTQVVDMTNICGDMTTTTTTTMNNAGAGSGGTHLGTVDMTNITIPQDMVPPPPNMAAYPGQYDMYMAAQTGYYQQPQQVPGMYPQQQQQQQPGYYNPGVYPGYIQQQQQQPMVQPQAQQRGAWGKTKRGPSLNPTMPIQPDSSMYGMMGGAMPQYGIPQQPPGMVYNQGYQQQPQPYMQQVPYATGAAPQIHQQHQPSTTPAAPVSSGNDFVVPAPPSAADMAGSQFSIPQPPGLDGTGSFHPALYSNNNNTNNTQNKSYKNSKLASWAKQQQ